MPKTNARKIATAERIAKAVEMRKAGATYTLIATQLGYADESGAFRAVNRALQALNDKLEEDLTEMKRLELERLDRLMMTIWTKATQGHLASIDRVLRIMERRAKLLGLDAPLKGEHKVDAFVHTSEKPTTPAEAQDFLDKMLGSRHTVQ